MQNHSITRRSLLSYLDDYLQRGDAIMFAQRRGLRHVRWSYEQLVLTARRIAHELESRGIAKGERVLLCGENSPEWVAAFWGCLLRGAVVVPLDKDSTEQFVFSVRQQTDAKLIMASSGVAVIERLAAGVELLNVPLLTLDELSERIAPHSSQPYPLEDVDESTLVEIIFTSGTTSTPKGVLLTHGNLLANLLPLEAEIKKYLKWERFFHPLRFLNLVPLSHVFGQFMGVFVPQLLGGEVHFHDTLNPAEIVRRTRESRISVIVLVPRVLDSLREWVERNYGARPCQIGQLDQLKERIARAEHANFLRRWWMFRHVHRDFGWKFWAFLSGGATLDERTETFWRRLGFAVLQGYGMTETASLVSVTHPFKGGHGSIGKLMPGYEVKLDEAGEIIVRGASVSPGYLTAAGRINRNPDDWLHTGDMGDLDDAGNLYFKGRKKDVIVTAAGLNIYPEDLEEAINRQPEVRASCVIKWSGAHGTEPLAVLILRDSRASAQAAIERANQSLAEHQWIRRWYVWTEADFPRTATDTVIKREVVARIKDEGGRIKDETRNSQSSFITGLSSASSSFVFSAAARITGHAPSVERKPSLKLTTDLKLDSLGRIELLTALEERYQIDIDEAAFTAATTVEEVERMVRGEMEERAAPYPYPKWSRRFPLTWIRALLIYILILPITRVMSRMRVEGRGNVDGLAGPALFVANHVTLADHALILTALPARLRNRLTIAMEGERLRDWVHPPAGTGWFMQLRLLVQYLLVTTFFQVFPLPKGSGFRRSFAYAGKCVDRGESVLVFPEGERAPRGQMNMSSFKTGIGLLAKELDATVVPVKLHGLYELKQRQKYFAPPGVVRVVFGEPIKFDTRLKPAAIAEELECRIAAL
ncbi:MAG TPA: AMP-binding protein [Pyrinomonadaceae bacterium]|nr:AMP-binding protein [Pyrinomonadaceae bacterium]